MPPDCDHETLTRRLIEAEVNAASNKGLESYLAGALRDGTYSRRHKTFRLSQSDPGWRDLIRAILDRLSRRNWTYLETGRQMYVVEWCGSPGDMFAFKSRRDFARGYFDAEGGTPRDAEARFYIQLTQKNRRDLENLRSAIIAEGIRCGCLHNPSVRVDPDYWRFYIATASHRHFMTRIGSWHPRKRSLFRQKLLDRPP